MHAFGYGLPVITSDNASDHMPEFSSLRPGINGFVFRSGDIPSMVDAVLRLLNDRVLRARMGDSAREEARVRCNTRVMAQRFRELMRVV